MKLAIVGIQGVPNNYGGFETLVEYLVEHLGKELDITVYCSSKDIPTRQKLYKGSCLKYIPISSHGAMGILYDSISFISAFFRNDKILVLGFGAGFIIPFFKMRKDKIIVNMGGLDWKRSKWNPFAQKIIRIAEKKLLQNAGQIISDNIGIQTYIKDTYNLPSEFIPYGGDQVLKINITKEDEETYSFLSSPYAFNVSRIQPDNNIVLILEAFSRTNILPLVMVGNWSSSKFGQNTKLKYSSYPNLFLLDAIYDQQKLDLLRSNCTLYIHGHSAGGTNPSLVEAMALGLPIIAFASGYNEFTTFNKALFFQDLKSLEDLIFSYKTHDLEKISTDLKGLAEKYYRWSVVAEKYKKVIQK